MRANERTLIATDTFFLIPRGNFDSGAAFFVSSASDGESSVRKPDKFAYSEIIALLTVHNVLNVADKGGRVDLLRFMIHACIFNVPRANVNFMQSLNALVNGGAVHIDDILTL